MLLRPRAELIRFQFAVLLLSFQGLHKNHPFQTLLNVTCIIIEVTGLNRICYDYTMIEKENKSLLSILYIPLIYKSRDVTEKNTHYILKDITLAEITLQR